MTEPLFPASPVASAVPCPGAFNTEVLRLAEAARSLCGAAGSYDEDAMRRAVRRVEVATCMGAAGLREGVGLTLLVQVFLNGERDRPRLQKAIGLLAAEILSLGAA